MVSRRAFLAGLGAAGVAAHARGARAGGGLFASPERLAALRAGAGSEARDAFLARAAGLRAHIPQPFAAPPEAIRFGWREPAAPPDDTLREAVDRLHRDTDAARDLALAFAMGDAAAGAASARLLLAWARGGRPVNLYDYDPDFAAGTMRGGTQGFGSARPWNFGLDMIWQGYGLLNGADALLLLRHGGYEFDADEAAALDEWLRSLAEATNSGLHAWTRWAEANAGGVAGAQFHGGFGGENAAAAALERHLTDNHLSWAMAALLAAAAALEDRALAAHVLAGDPWRDRRAGLRRNPAPLPDVIRRAIEPDGRVYEERIGRRPPIRYALFHLEAWCLAARISETRSWAAFWGGETGAAMLAVFRRYAPYLRGEARSPLADEVEVKARWLFALTPAGFGGVARTELMRTAPIPSRMTNAIGPAALLLGS